MADPRNDLPRCPRCGYDLSGQWTPDAGGPPARRTCSECGHEYDSHSVADPARPVAGFIEHERGGLGRLTAAAWRTAGWILYPGMFWRRVSLECPIVRLRWIVWMLALLVPLHCAASVISNARTFILPPTPGTPIRTELLTQFVGGWVYPFATVDSPLVLRFRSLSSVFPMFVWCGLIACAAAWGLALALIQTRRENGVSRAQVHRAGVYSLVWVAGLGLFRTARNLELFCSAMLDPARAQNRGVLRLTEIETPIVAVPLIAWVALWWLFTLKDGWRIKHWGPVWIAVALVASLSALIPAAWEPEIRFFVLVASPRW